MAKENFILMDWAGNRLTDFNGNALEFNSFDDGWSYILENYSSENSQYDDLFVIEKTK